MSSRSSAAEDKRARILEAAFEVCDRQGVAAARMEEVAALAKVSKGTLYRFFRSKEELFLATMIESYREGLRLVSAHAARATDPVELLDEVLEGLVDVLRFVGPRMRVYYQAWGVVASDAEFQERLLGFLRSFHAEREEEHERLIRRGQEVGVFRREVSPEAMATAIGALLQGFLYRAAFDPGSASPEKLRACFDKLVRDPLLVEAPARPAGDPLHG